MVEISALNRQLDVVRQYFSKSEEYATAYQGNNPSAHFYNTRIRRVLEMLEGFKEGRVLDVGCGPALIARAFRGKPIEYDGVDISEDMIESCTKTYREESQFRFTTGAIEMLVFPGESFDVVLCLGVLEYVLDALMALREVVRVLKPNGIAVVAMLNSHSPYRLWRAHVYSRLRNGVARVRRVFGARSNRYGAPGVGITPRLETFVHSESALRRLLSKAGLVPEDVVYYDFNVMVSPVDEVMPSVSVLVSGFLESLCRSSLKFLGTGFMIKCRKARSKLP